MVAIRRLVLCTLIIASQAECTLSVDIDISSSCTTGQHCLADLSVPIAPRVTLTLSPGNHQLSTDLTLQGKTSWELKDAGIGLSNISCTKGSSCSISLPQSSQVKVSNLTFSNCRLVFTGTNNTDIQNCQFLRVSTGALRFTNSNNVSVDQCNFNNYKKLSSTVLSFSHANGIHVTRCKFTDITGRCEFTDITGR